jgi:hypothetical protein
MEKQIVYPCKFKKWELYERFNLAQFDKDRVRFKNSVLNSSRINCIQPYFTKKYNKTCIDYIYNHMYRYDVKYLVTCENNLITLTKKEDKFNIFQDITKWAAVIFFGILSIVCMIAPNIPWPVPVFMLFMLILLFWLSRLNSKKARDMIDEYIKIVIDESIIS